MIGREIFPIRPLLLKKIPELLEDGLFKKGYQQASFSEEEDTSLEDDAVAFNEINLVTDRKEKPVYTNAFELISSSPSFNLNSWFEKQKIKLQSDKSGKVHLSVATVEFKNCLSLLSANIFIRFHDLSTFNAGNGTKKWDNRFEFVDTRAHRVCVTSAETVMLEKQSLDEFLNNSNSGKAVIVSLSPQSRTSIAAHFGISPIQVLVASPFDNPIIEGLYDKWPEQPGSVKARKYMHTQYHPVEKSITSQLHNR
ncbi:hypothetical protein Fmac_007230 [Flemingia macrophylla]|uniref:NAF domain-containing protein n=1 Tax=Flemingia macrophylla TaxID=520843 RepID=A0ABD1NCV2_9FABA